MIECLVPDSDEDDNQLAGSIQPYVRESDRVGWSSAGEQGLQHASEQPDCVGLMKKPKVLYRLQELPEKCWTRTKNESRGCQYCTKVRFGPIALDVMLDSGAGLNTIPEDALVSVINACEQAGM